MRSQNLELHIVDHCNLRCLACSHDSPEMAPRMESTLDLENALRRLWAFYQAPLLKLLGGEPLLHPDLTEIIAAVKRVCGARVRLVTNGLLLSSRRSDLLGVDEVHISNYPNVKLPSLDLLVDISAELNAPVTVQAFDHFRWHKVDIALPPKTVGRIFKTCQMFHDWQCHTIRRGRFYPCPAAATWAEDNMDFVDLLDDSVEVEAKLKTLLVRSSPLDSCSKCLGSAGTLVAHSSDRRKIELIPIAPAAVDTEFLAKLERAPESWNECYEYAYTVFPSGKVIAGEVL